MSSSQPDPPPPQKPKSGARAALEFTGIPPSWFDKRPSLPSRNWLIFIAVTSSVIGYYSYDRRQSRLVREEYIARVRHLAEEPLHSLDFPRKVTVYGAKWPGDDEWDRSTRYFRKYVKPIFVAAAVDYQIIAGKRHGDLATRVANDIKSERRIALGLDPLPQPVMALPSHETPEKKRQRAMDGGIVVVGRPAFKEYMAGFRRGWTESLEKVDKEEVFARSLENDGRFDEPEAPEPTIVDSFEAEPLPTPSRLPQSRPGALFSPLNSMRAPPPPPSVPRKDPGADVLPPAQIPPQPPLLLVPFVNLVGLKLIPNMIWDFFNERHKVRAGAEAAFKLVMRETRPFVGPSHPTFASDLQSSPQTNTDLDFDKDAERFYKSSTASIPEEVEKARETYYKALVGKLATARELARGEREPSEAERNAPPPTEVELRAERLKKEMRWTEDVKGWEIVKPEAPVEWDERADGSLRVFVDPQSASFQSEVAKSS
ncbi:hypothetical protein BV25DRAFT_1991555 [Artomyces pyxidatus]|uniref:Uncharacterized protein n=1 Tax=Artomyces pyxidatus TaxID=48021 RepID=A0ACB8T1I8_9AGAM|nr:hypothetical protein BV25DRAFT_1991555 [Artomyces pyxidatus]